MGFPGDLALATRSPGKIREIMRVCSDWPVRWQLARSPDDPTHVSARWPDVEETGEGYLENARLKARSVSEALGVPAVADDSGIEVDALRGEPGPRSARLAGPGATDRQNLDVLIHRIQDVPADDRRARYRCVAVCAWPDGREVWAEAVCEGRLILEPRGSNGFGYDPIFVPNGERRTMAELSSEEKDAISHRGKAFRELGEILARSPA
ncbi:MAG TPA: RdgB/HAM1 family non-canonical purine NTP pyrophosphatase [Actinomycetota bacterium]|nr:RdgB/HAM1 family non-canonical purine NTP pyrophosphatase [Actinomycetota bacterium]